MRMYLYLVPVVLLSALADVDVPIRNHWNGGFEGDACVDITQDLHNWTMTLTFDQPIASLDVYTAKIKETKDGGKVYVLENNDWNKEEHAGDRLCVGFQGHGSGDISPKLTASLEGLPNGGSLFTGVTEIVTDASGHTLPTPTAPIVTGTRLAIKDNYFTYDGKRVFLSGGNLPWISYAYDFGEGQWQYRRAQAEEQLKKLHEAGGNSLRLWIHIQGETSPAFDSSGLVTGLDTKGTFINDFKDLLTMALKYNILLFPTLWNAAVNQDTHNRLDGLVKDPVKLQSYLDNALTPWVKAVNGHPALGGWDIMNEPEGMINPEVPDDDPCFDTTSLKNSGAGWAGRKYDYKQYLRFLNWQVAAIKAVDPKNLVSVGVWNPKSNTDILGMIDHYSDLCLVKGGGKPEGVMDFYQYHSYSWNNQFDDVAVFKHSYADYGVEKPILVGEFWERDGGGLTISQMFDWVYNNSYAGAWSWDLVGNGDNQRGGISHIKDYTGNGAIPIDLK